MAIATPTKVEVITFLRRMNLDENHTNYNVMRAVLALSVPVVNRLLGAMVSEALS